MAQWLVFRSGKHYPAVTAKNTGLFPHSRRPDMEVRPFVPAQASSDDRINLQRHKSDLHVVRHGELLHLLRESRSMRVRLKTGDIDKFNRESGLWRT